MKKPKRKRTAAEKRSRRERKKMFLTIFINGKQKRVPRVPLIDGLPEDEFMARNADPVWLHQNELWEFMQNDVRPQAATSVDSIREADHRKEALHAKPHSLQTMNITNEPYSIPADLSGQTLAAILRKRFPEQTWSQVRKLVAARRVHVDEALCLDPARRLQEGDVLEVLSKPAPVHLGATVDGLVIRHLDDDLVVVEKASGVNTVRHPAERDWTDRRRELSPTLEDLTLKAIADQLGRAKHTLGRLRIVHRLDKDTSGLVVFARSIPAERGLGKQFHAHTVLRRYIAIVPGRVKPQTFSTWLVRDRGDGRRGSGPAGQGKIAITHVDVIEQLPGHTVLSCRLETGRTHQIRIHLSEAGHPVCGEKVYKRPSAIDADDAPRLALHAAQLGFEHPTTGKHVEWEMELPLDLQGFLVHLRRHQHDPADRG